jgi:hypothetical protein
MINFDQLALAKELRGRGKEKDGSNRNRLFAGLKVSWCEITLAGE